ncbi:MAG: hypothetical protein HQL46_13935 [Gammaproteobacteria bacterium]|nr:hypothetical protein [Gammaproteobacteria bacterium]
MKSANEIKKKLLKDWERYLFHKYWLQNEELFPYQIKLTKPNDKTLLHHFDEVRNWINELTTHFNRRISDSSSIILISKNINYAMMGQQKIPIAIEFSSLESLAKYLGKWQQWQLFNKLYHHIIFNFPSLKAWLINSPAVILKYQSEWSQLLAVCQYLQQHPKPNCYIRQLNIEGVDTKFIEKHKLVLKNMLDIVLPVTDYYSDHDKLSEHGFEKRYGLLYELPRIRFRLLDQSVSSDLLNISDIELAIDQFAQVNFPDLFCDRIFITENKVNGLVFPELKNTMVIFGLGYGIQILKHVNWLKKCQIYYWGDIDTHGFAILSQARQYFPQIKSWLMDKESLMFCRHLWGVEDKKPHPSQSLPGLNEREQEVYQGLKNNLWQQSLRLEQEKIPYDYWITKLQAIA